MQEYTPTLLRDRSQVGPHPPAPSPITGRHRANHGGIARYVFPLTLALSPQAGRGEFLRGICAGELHTTGLISLTDPIAPISTLGLIPPSPLPVDPIVPRSPGNESAAGAQAVPVPVTISGELWDNRPGGAGGLAHYYRFHATANQPLVVDVTARRSGSPLDLFIQVLDASGKPVEQAVLRAVGQSEITLFDKDSA